MKSKVKAKITRIVTETATCILDNDGNVEEVLDIHDEHDYEVTELHSVISVINEW
ncbi:hypothetical protein [Gorillibacterium sp. CAU 1737]|uniref:hypothetical protein n=1 Tax=Gorillibacterium sp. CAU 1737 TaxID=3140362 RepID=UPI003261AF7D